jgi:NADPH-dependent glutamate synthase beta subunit-like oxidoreductase
MSLCRLHLKTAPPASETLNNIYASFSRRVSSGDRGICPLELTGIFLKLCQSQSCGKCVPCRSGLGRIAALLEGIDKGSGSEKDIELIKKTAGAVADSADCAIGYDAANAVLDAVETYSADLKKHAKNASCMSKHEAVRCVTDCPAHVDISGYIALCGQQRYEDALRLIRKDNPFPSTCALICENPCEKYCRRGIIDDSINIRAIKRSVIEKAAALPPETVAPASGKKVAVIGSGPAGLSAAYYLALMGHEVTVYEKRKRLGGMLRYGIPAYRLPDKYLDADIDYILSHGIKTVMGVEVGGDLSFADLTGKYDSVFVTIGAQGSKSLGIPGEDSKGVLSAVKLLSDIGDGEYPDFSGKDVIVVGGGNVAMDAVRSSIRLGAKTVKCVYRRRVIDMPALYHEIEGAVAEGAEMLPLYAPLKLLADAEGQVKEMIVQPQIVGEYKAGRPVPLKARLPEKSIKCDIIITAIGQGIQSDYFAKQGMKLQWDQIATDLACVVTEMPGVFAGGDCVSGPSTVVKAIEAGKVAAANIDVYLGGEHTISVNVKIPPASMKIKKAWGRVVCRERESFERRRDFDLVELPLSDEETAQECARCLRCDHFGLGTLKDGRMEKW